MDTIISSYDTGERDGTKKSDCHLRVPSAGITH